MFLEWLGVRWWSPDETFFPTCPSADKFIWACEEQWYANQAVATKPGSKPVEVRNPGTWTAGTHPLWALRMRINTGGYDRSSPAANKVLWANASLGRGGIITYTGLPVSLPLNIIFEIWAALSPDILSNYRAGMQGGGGGASVFNLVDRWPLVDNCTAKPPPKSYGGCYTRACGANGGNPSLCPPLELCQAHP